MATTRGTGTRSTSNFASIFIFIALIIGAVAGAAVGWTLAGRIGDRLLSIFAALFAVVAIWSLRHVLGDSYPDLFARPRDKSIPPAIWLGVAFSSVVGGLAGHDIGLLFGVTTGALFGLTSGTIAGASMAMLVIVYLHEHPEEHSEF